ncbi:MAG: acyl-CoA thioester hydrolase/BAAT C-terminal domain-containing protein [Erythrobacter sp.]|uniref:alpha/beta hydrolase family protein n=1 Tax=Erythrobacter sp. TaxID=1042 RepID=UPI002638B9DF|nr:acyl-CoA thioester hydrolase/BAAT C-terminal domain-containing protein [Erythrobacter sp.]MDJ0978033.1 acyl-CoA thioester hydrolase/BAAT C-terminal domain-containing protein [Erythrobacter sp.]
MKPLHSLAVFALIIAAPSLAEPRSPAIENEILVGESLPGAFYATPEGKGPFPAIILLGGSEGGDRGARSLAPQFLEAGYAVLGLPYYSPAWGDRPQQFPGLPRAFANIPVEMAGKAKDWLAARPDVRGADIAIYGVSKGAELALLAGSRIDGFAAIAAIAPSDVVWEGWGTGDGTRPSSFSWQGEPLPFVPYEGMEEEFANPTGPSGRPRLRLPHDKGRNANPDRAVAARIAVESIDEPVLVAGGDADLVWNSGEMAQAIAERRAAANLPTVSLVFTDAGHALSGTGATNERRAEADLAAQRKIWPATLEFMARHLKD